MAGPNSVVQRVEVGATSQVPRLLPAAVEPARPLTAQRVEADTTSPAPRSLSAAAAEPTLPVVESSTPARRLGVGLGTPQVRRSATASALPPTTPSAPAQRTVLSAAPALPVTGQPNALAEPALPVAHTAVQRISTPVARGTTGLVGAKGPAVPNTAEPAAPAPESAGSPDVLVVREAPAPRRLGLGSPVQRYEEPPEAVAPPVVQAVQATPTAQAEPEPPPPPAPAPPAAPPEASPEELLKKIYDPLVRRLKAELWLDRERRGSLTDLWH